MEYWKKYNKKPYVDGSNPDEVYLILFYTRRRALLVRKNLTVICTMETRKAKELVKEARDNEWITDHESQMKLVKYENYPREAEAAYWIKYKSVGEVIR